MTKKSNQWDHPLEEVSYMDIKEISEAAGRLADEEYRYTPEKKGFH